MRITANTRQAWIPDFEENKKASESERIRISYNKPKAYQRTLWSKTVAVREPSGRIESFIDKDIKAIILESDVKIENLIIEGTDKDGNKTEKKILTGSDLVESTSDICYLLTRQLADKITEVTFKGELEKNSEQASERSSRE